MTATEAAPVHGLVQGHQKKLITRMSERYGVDADQFFSTIKKTIMPSEKATNEDMIAFLLVADKYELNPFTKEIYAFPGKGGGITPMVGVDGWLKIANRDPNFDGIEVEILDGDNGEPYAATCIVYRKDRKHQISVTEYFDECKRGTEPWKQMPRRMLRHKAMIQCIRVAFGVTGIVDEDESRDVQEIDARVVASEVKAATVTEKIRAAKQRAASPVATAVEIPAEKAHDAAQDNTARASTIKYLRDSAELSSKAKNIISATLTEAGLNPDDPESIDDLGDSDLEDLRVIVKGATAEV